MNLSEIFLTDGTISPKLMLWAFYFAVVIAAIVYYLINVQLADFVNKLLEAGADSPENAISLSESDIKVGFITKICLKSPANYKNLLVAITSDGKYYSNASYSDEPPKFKALHAITRQRKSRVTESKSDLDNTVLEVEDTNTQEITPDLTKTDTQNSEMFNVKQSTDTEINEEDSFTDTYAVIQHPERIKFTPLTARYYIPKEIHDKVKALYNKPKSKVWIILLSLLGFGAIIFLAGIAVDAIINSVGTLGK